MSRVQALEELQGEQAAIWSQLGSTTPGNERHSQEPLISPPYSPSRAPASLWLACIGKMVWIPKTWINHSDIPGICRVCCHLTAQDMK